MKRCYLIIGALFFSFTLIAFGFSTMAYELDADSSLYAVVDEEADNITEAFPAAYTSKDVPEVVVDSSLYAVVDEEADNITEAFPAAYTSKVVPEASPDLFFYGVIEEDQANLYEWIGTEE